MLGSGLPRGAAQGQLRKEGPMQIVQLLCGVQGIWDEFFRQKDPAKGTAKSGRPDASMHAYGC